ncbi:DoxX family membrane protein [Dinghuibacter silviterrae]|uniref:Putative membrane protein n=1 Tax=Dinghuibacter silviterrae TaxID=1539049 RepID=A0A4R8DH35_9BACT|nr:DoxX family membrane protein [Dinghuibacter silviterrae]TDW96270.1 putative membrane protein [Dinghuibacter silviterrae]
MKRIILFILCLLAGLMFINAGLDKFFHYMPVPKQVPEKVAKTVAAFMEIGWLMPLTGTIEILGGLLLIFPRTRALGAIVILPVLAGILLANINMNPSSLPIVLVLIAIVFWAIFDNRAKYLPMIAK